MSVINDTRIHWPTVLTGADQEPKNAITIQEQNEVTTGIFHAVALQGVKWKWFRSFYRTEFASCLQLTFQHYTVFAIHCALKLHVFQWSYDVQLMTTAVCCLVMSRWWGLWRHKPPILCAGIATESRHIFLVSSTWLWLPDDVMRLATSLPRHTNVTGLGHAEPCEKSKKLKKYEFRCQLFGLHALRANLYRLLTTVCW